LSLHFVGGVLDGLDYVLIASAAAQVPFEPVPNLIIAWVRVPRQDLSTRHYHSGRAIPALKSVVFPESLLHWMKLAISGHALYGRDLGAISLNGKHSAGFYCLTAEGNGAGATNRRLTSDVSTGQPKHIAQIMH